MSLQNYTKAHGYKARAAVSKPFQGDENQRYNARKKSRTLGGRKPVHEVTTYYTNTHTEQAARNLLESAKGQTKKVS